AFEAGNLRKFHRLARFQIAQDVMLPVLRPVDGIVFVAFHLFENQLDGTVRRAKSLGAFAKSRGPFLLTGAFHFRPGEIRRCLRGRLPLRFGLETLHAAAFRLDTPVFKFVLRDLAREDDRLAVRREHWVEVLAALLFRQLAEQRSLLTIEIEVGMALARGLKITNRDDDFGAGVCTGGNEQKRDGYRDGANHQRLPIWIARRSTCSAASFTASLNV